MPAASGDMICNSKEDKNVNQTALSALSSVPIGVIRGKIMSDGLMRESEW